MADPLRFYRIPFVGLKEGLTVLDFEIDDTFFANFPEGDVHGAQIRVEVKLDKKSNFFILTFGISGVVRTTCDRCMEEFDLELLDEHTVFVKFHENAEEMEEGDDVIYLHPSETHLDLSKLIYEFILLSFPMVKVHPPDEFGNSGCNESVIDKIQPPEEEVDEDAVDPRWEALKKLKD